MEAPGIETPSEGGDPQGSRRFPQATGAANVPSTAAKCAKPRHADESQTKPADPRTVLLAQLAEGMRAALAEGDVEAARIAHETIGRLLAAAETSGSSTPARKRPNLVVCCCAVGAVSTSALLDGRGRHSVKNLGQAVFVPSLSTLHSDRAAASQGAARGEK